MKGTPSYLMKFLDGSPLIWERLDDKTACRIKDEIACQPSI